MVKFCVEESEMLGLNAENNAINIKPVLVHLNVCRSRRRQFQDLALKVPLSEQYKAFCNYIA